MINLPIKLNLQLKMFAKGIILLLVFYAICFAGWTVFFTETGNGDNVEHIHVSWLVAHGKMPYRDFFQHHNPLLWYLFAPFVTFSKNILILLDTAHAVGIVAGLLTFYIVVRVCVRFFSTSIYTALLSLLILCPPYFYIYCFNFNPDTFMALCYAAGIYALFAYWEHPRLETLCLSFFLFFMAFLFTQKILMVLFVLGIICLLVFYKEETPLADILYALLLPICGLLLFVAYLYYQDSLEIYWKSNYLFNVELINNFGNKNFDVVDFYKLIPAIVLSCVSILCFFKTENKYFKIIAVLFIIELLLRLFYFAISPYYMLPLMIYMCCLNAVLLKKISSLNILLLYPILGLCIYYAAISVPNYLSVRGKDRSFATFLSQNLTPCDYILSSYFGNQSIITKDIHYYWAMLGHLDIIGNNLGIYPKPDLNELVIKYKPKLIYGGIYWNSYYEHRGQNVLWQRVTPEIIEKYYLPTPIQNFYILKYEYQKHSCQYDSVKKEWSYAD